jgi:hypothetical protein
MAAQQAGTSPLHTAEPWYVVAMACAVRWRRGGQLPCWLRLSIACCGCCCAEVQETQRPRRRATQTPVLCRRHALRECGCAATGWVLISCAHQSAVCVSCVLPRPVYYLQDCHHGPTYHSVCVRRRLLQACHVCARAVASVCVYSRCWVSLPEGVLRVVVECLLSFLSLLPSRQFVSTAPVQTVKHAQPSYACERILHAG